MNANVFENNELSQAPADLIPELSVVMPAYNEEDALPVTVPEAVAALDAVCLKWELIVVDDGSTDGTADVLREQAAREPRIRVLTQRINQGYGKAMRRGFDAARYLVVGTTDADGQFDLRDFALLYPPLRGVHLVAGYRIKRADPWRRKVASRVYNMLVRLVLGLKVRDLNCTLKLYRKSLLLMIELEADHFLFDTEIFARTRAAGLEWVEVGVPHYPRRFGTSTVATGSVMSALRELRDLRRRL